MDERNTQATEGVSTNLNDLDLSGIDFSEGKDGAEPAPAAAPEAEAADQQRQAEGEADAEKTEAGEATRGTDQFTLKHLDSVQTVSRDEVVTLAQKGMDYDRLKTKSEERYSVLEAEKKLADLRISIFDEIAKTGGFQDVDDLIETIQAEQLAERDGLDKATALAQVRLERRERALSQKERTLDSPEDRKARIDADARAFIEKHPRLDFDAIPKEVWDRVHHGESLVAAYDDFTAAAAQEELAAENQRLKTALEATKKNAENKQRSTGSATSVGKEPVKDPWLADLKARFD